jgi:hypothetical protein
MIRIVESSGIPCHLSANLNHMRNIDATPRGSVAPRVAPARSCGHSHGRSGPNLTSAGAQNAPIGRYGTP